MSDDPADPLLAWYDRSARELPWRKTVTPWGVLVSEVMLQQTPVARVVPVYESWLCRWPTPTALASDSPGEAVRLWGRLGYPRRALRLHAAATVCVHRHDGCVPDDLDALLALPGVGSYTAAAVASFAFGQRHAVLDTNVRRVQARLFEGEEFERPGAPSVAERSRALGRLPDGAAASSLSVAFMELGALVCTARAPACEACPVRRSCAWLLAGRPAWSGAPRSGQSYAGTDRQCRGTLLAVLRDARDPVPVSSLDRVWSDPAQRLRALDSLVSDGLVEPLPGNRYQLPSSG
ncbi:MAG: A/G-specific adenine glycosylase [Actinomycetes bacterium]